MKKYLLLCFLLLTIENVFAGQVAYNEALKRAQNFLKTKGINLINPIQTRTTKNDTASIYAFNVGDNKGFVLVSGEEKTPDILGYSTSGSIDLDNVPIQLKGLLNDYRRQIRYLRKNPNAKIVQTRAANSSDIVAPMITTLWDQSSPYNDLCPLDGTSRSLTGCVATAMAQIIAYHKYPTALIEDIPEYTVNTGNNTTKIYPGYSKGSTIDWANIQNTYNRNSTNVQKTAVAQLMAYCGAGTKMEYSAEASGAYDEDAAKALIKYFGYDDGVKYKYRLNFTTEAWEEMLLTELKESRPVLYGGVSTGGGHTFVIDGYDGEGKYHVNWGWSGLANGYFVLFILNPNTTSGAGASSTEDGYSSYQDMIIGIKPDDGISYKGNSLSMYITEATINKKDKSKATVRYTAFNAVALDTTFNYGLATIDNDNNITLIGSSKEYFLLQDKSIAISQTLRASSFANAGKYKIVAVSKIKSDENDFDWIISSNKDINYIEAEVELENNKKVFRSITLREVIENVVAENFNFTTQKKHVGRSQNVNFKLVNKGDSYQGTVFIFASTTNDKGDYKSYTGIYPRKGETLDIAMNFTPDKAGKYTVWITTDESGRNVIGQETVEITEAPATTTEGTLTSIVINDATKRAGYTNVLELTSASISGTIIIQNDNTTLPFNDVVTIRLWKNTSGNSYSSVSAIQQEIDIPAGSVINIPFSFENIETNRYYVSVRSKSISQNGNIIYFTLDNSATNIEDIYADDNIIDKVVYSINGIKITTLKAGEKLENLSLPKGIYIVGGKKIKI